MGNKLGKMVTLKKTIYILTLSLPLFADLPPIYKKDFEQNSYSLDIEKNAQLFSISGNRLGISIKDTSIGRPSLIAIKNMRLLSPEDKYALKVLDTNKKEIFMIGLGDPFYIHAQHIDFEDRDFFGGYVDADIDIALPFDADISYFVLMSQENRFLKKISEIKVK